MAPSQGSVAHDHSGSLCGLRVVQGCLTEQLFVEDRMPGNLPGVLRRKELRALVRRASRVPCKEYSGSELMLLGLRQVLSLSA